ncbi:hypothetical protein [Carnimonas bestiolae]|uniref:hypothetical protein n=1 Tax=Carnimonas bestiolae TaxID=3402172 RepID=UPI003EDC2A5E
MKLSTLLLNGPVEAFLEHRAELKRDLGSKVSEDYDSRSGGNTGLGVGGVLATVIAAGLEEASKKDAESEELDGLHQTAAGLCESGQYYYDYDDWQNFGIKKK